VHSNKEQPTYEQLLARIQSFDVEIKSRDVRIRILEEQLQLARVQKFGPSAERFSPDQMALALNEAESLTAGIPVTAEPASVTVPEHTRKVRGHRKALSADLPRVEVTHDLPDSEKVCAHDGATLTVIGQDTSEQLDYVPATVRVLKHVRLKYGCPCCDRSIKTASKPAQLLPKSNASPGLLAQIATAKYVDGTPLYRQEAQFERLGVHVPRVTSARWMIELSEKIIPLMNLLHEHCVAQSLIHIDETPVQVLKSDKSVHSEHYMWVRCAGPPGRRVVLFEYDKSRSSAVPKRLLDGFTGAVLADGYEAYAAALKNAPTIVHAGCWAHARRKFDEAKKAAHQSGIERAHADDMIKLIGQLYAIERTLKDQQADAAERLSVRTQRAAPIIEGMKQWLITHQSVVLPQSLLGKAIAYTLNQWNKLTVFLEHSHIPLDNNRAENAIRPFVVGRKNWLFCDTVAGANASARLYSLIETAKANGLEPHGYLTRLFTELPSAHTLEDIEKLLPFKQE
jgi:transposase